MIEHTPGPWTYKEELGANLSAVSSSKRVVAGIPNDGAINPDELTEQRANARLIAAAPTAPHECDDLNCPGNINRKKLEAFPDLLEACRHSLGILGSISHPYLKDSLLLEIKAAINKATG